MLNLAGTTEIPLNVPIRDTHLKGTGDPPLLGLMAEIAASVVETMIAPAAEIESKSLTGVKTRLNTAETTEARIRADLPTKKATSMKMVSSFPDFRSHFSLTNSLRTASKDMCLSCSPNMRSTRLCISKSTRKTSSRNMSVTRGLEKSMTRCSASSASKLFKNSHRPRTRKKTLKIRTF